MVSAQKTRLSSVFYDAYRSYVMIRKKADLSALLIVSLRNIMLSFGLLCLCYLARVIVWPESLLFFSGFLVALSILEYKKRQPVMDEKAFTKSFEILFPDKSIASWQILQDSGNYTEKEEDEYRLNLKDFLISYKAIKRKDINENLWGLVFPAIFILASVFIVGLQPLLQGIAPALSDLTGEYAKPVITVIRGQDEKESETSTYTLSSDNVASVHLISPNLVRLTLDRSGLLVNSVVELFSETGAKEAQNGFQSFRMSEVYTDDTSQEIRGYELSFSVGQNVHLKIPGLYGDRVLANILVRKPPLPEVSLDPEHNSAEPWPDDKPLPLKISVRTHAPLKKVQLRIRTAGRESQELVLNVDQNQIFSWSTRYDLLLEPWINSDTADVEIVAEAVDAAIPVPLTGHSQPVLIRTENAYGRYRSTLNLLRQLKTHMDESRKSLSGALPEEAVQLAHRALVKSASTPFFDALDRIQIRDFAEIGQSLRDHPRIVERTDLSERLNRFLVEHEILDDRERDRDFFVAARALSRLMEQPAEQRPVTVSVATQNLEHFILNRRERWKLRVSYLSHPEALPQWSEVLEKKPFLSSQKQIRDEMAGESGGGATDAAMKVLSASVAEFRSWIELLEKHEDEDRRKKEIKRQHGLASAQQKLHDLQKRQDKISGILDKSSQGNLSDLQENWPTTRLHQNTNLKEAQHLVAEMQSLSPQAGVRIQAATDAMGLSLEQGDSRNYVKAESFSDLAGRLLREARKAAMEAGHGQGQRRRRRVSGDRYYGQSVHSGDLEMSRDYQVDQRYREDVLNEVLSIDQNKEDSQYLEEYIRKIIR